MAVIGYFVRHPNAANLMMAAAVILGMSSLPNMERETFPEFTPSRVTVDVAYPGASAIDVDEGVCQDLDEALTAITALDDFECQSTEGRATATLTLVDGGGITQFYNDILSEVSALDSLPDEAEEPTVSIAAQEEQIALVAISGVESDDGLLRYADALAARLEALSMVSNANVTGISQREFRVSFDTRSLRQYGLSARDVSDAIEARSLRQPLGTARTNGQDITLRYTDSRRSASALEDLVIVETEDGSFVRIGDIGSVLLVPSSDEVQSFVDGARAAIIQISKNRDDDAIAAFRQVEDILVEEQMRFPDPFAITVINDSTENISQRIDLVLFNTALGLVLVFVVMSAYFSPRDALWISAALPVSLIGGFFIISLLGVTINMISLIAMLMAVGLIMDDSIVIADNIAKWRVRTDAKTASIRGAREVMPGVLSSFLTTACVFTPLMFLSGEIGSILEVVPVVLIVVLAISLFEAFLILPHHLSHAAKNRSTEQRLAPRLTEAVKTRFVIPIVASLVRWRYLTLGLTFAVLIGTVGLITSGTVKVIGFPTTEGDTIEARVALTAGMPLDRTVSVVDQLLEGLSGVDRRLSSNTADGEPLVERMLVRFATNADVRSNGPHTATITVDLQSSETRNVAADDVLQAWRQAAGPIADLSQSNFTQTGGGPGGSDLDVQLAARDLATLEAATGDLFRRLVARNDVTEAYMDFTSGQTEIALMLNPFGYSLGLTPQSLATQLRAAFSGTETDRFTDDFSTIAVRSELGDAIPTIAALESYPVAVRGGEQTALQTVADLQIAQSYTQITRQNGFAISRIIGKIDRQATTSTALSQTIMSQYAPAVESAYPGVSISIGGATEAQQETQSSIVAALLVGLVGVYLILAYQFHSYALPVVVMLSIPFAIIGVVFGHMLVGIDIAMPSFVGFASLAGIVVNNAILFMTFFERETRQGDYVKGVLEAVSHRFRPVLLSFATTFVGLLPIVFETSPQAQTIVPLVTAVAFGLLSSTLLVIFVLPSAIAIYFDIFSIDKWMKTRAELDKAHEPVPAG